MPGKKYAGMDSILLPATRRRQIFRESIEEQILPLLCELSWPPGKYLDDFKRGDTAR